MTEEKNEAEPKSNKFLSRKFIVWFAATGFIVLAFVLDNKEALNALIPWWGSISIVFIGGNVAQDFALKGVKK